MHLHELREDAGNTRSNCTFSSCYGITRNEQAKVKMA